MKYIWGAVEITEDGGKVYFYMLSEKKEKRAKHKMEEKLTQKCFIKRKKDG